MFPLGTLSAEKFAAPSYTSKSPSAEKDVALLTEEPHVKAPPTIAQSPFLLDKVKPSSEVVAVKPAQVPDVYQVPPEMMQPVWLP